MNRLHITDEALREVRGLVSTANSLIQHEGPDGLEAALWRLVDAAGIISEEAADSSVGTSRSPTGRGYAVRRIPVN